MKNIKRQIIHKLKNNNGNINKKKTDHRNYELNWAELILKPRPTDKRTTGENDINKEIITAGGPFQLKGITILVNKSLLTRIIPGIKLDNYRSIRLEILSHLNYDSRYTLTINWANVLWKIGFDICVVFSFWFHLF